MKKAIMIFALILALVSVLALLSSCGDDKDKKTETPTPGTESSETAAPTPVSSETSGGMQVGGDGSAIEIGWGD